MNDEILKKLGYNSIALEMLLKREAQINPEDILMPGERPSINKDPSLNDLSSDTKSDVRNILNKLEEVERLINDLPEYTVAEEEKIIVLHENLDITWKRLIEPTTLFS